MALRNKYETNNEKLAKNVSARTGRTALLYKEAAEGKAGQGERLMNESMNE